jgi:hypothetical protein
MLGARRSTDGGRKEFDKVTVKDADGVHIATPLKRWTWAFLEARDAVGLSDVALTAILPSRYFTVAKTSTYFRTFRRGSGPMEKEGFESLPSGQVLRWEFTLSKHLPPGGEGGGRFVRPPDEDEFDAMLKHIGEHLGMSEWGHAYLYGRFKIKKTQ